jgi:hypothetical protein
VKPALTRLLGRLYSTGDEARTLLLGIGFDGQHIPAFKTAASFWQKIIPTLDDRLEDGTLLLLTAVVAEYPGAKDAVALLGQLTEAPVDRRPERAAGIRQVATAHAGTETAPPGLQRTFKNDVGSARAADVVPPRPPSADPDVPGQLAGCPTLTLEGADLSEEFLTATRALLGPDVIPLYIAHEQSAVRIPDPGDRGDRVRLAVEERMRNHEPKCRVTYRKFRFQPYAYKELTVRGPDNSPYTLDTVPATCTPEDIAAAVLARDREARTATQDGLVNAVIDRETDGPSIRLDAYLTLHECGVKPGDKLHVAPWATAGCLSPVTRMKAQLAAAAEIREYAELHPTELIITSCDDEQLPSRITVRLARTGLALPASLHGTTLADYPDSFARLTPERVETHQISIHFPAMFPLAAPLIVWESPVFHPNIRRTAFPGRTVSEGLPAGCLQFQPLLQGYRSEHTMKDICRVIGDVVAYRDYDLTEGEHPADPVAAGWAETEFGQTMIHEIGGRPLVHIRRDDDLRKRQPRPFVIRPTGGDPGGH